MIYLIKDRDYLKIGYATCIADRMKSYRTHTLYTELLDVKPGTTLDEKELQKRCKDYNVESEWFRNCPEVIEIWNKYESTIISDLDKIQCVINAADEELSKIHESLFENWPCEATSIVQILETVPKIDKQRIFKSLDFSYSELDKYKNLQYDYESLWRIVKAFKGEIQAIFRIDDYKYISEKKYIDGEVHTKMTRTKQLKETKESTYIK